ncbi:MAG: DEAD/DEAH box helicase [Eubacteriales bacterium]
MLFKEMNLIPPLLQAVRQAGYDLPTPIQQQTIPHVLAGRDILGCAQTGTGKTAAFALPILQRLAAETPARPLPVPGGGPGRRTTEARPIRALVLTPTRELAIQIHENFELYGQGLPLRTAVIFGGVNQNPQVRALTEGVDILIATPGRLLDLIGQGYIHLNRIGIFVLDEADRMLDMGFIRDVKRLLPLLPAKKQTLLFSATMPPEVEELALGLLREPVTVKVAPVASTVEQVSQCVYLIAKTDKTPLLLDLLQHRGVSCALVFTRTKHGADQLARTLGKNRIKAAAIHGGKGQGARQAALAQFKDGEIDVLVATDIAARGIDISALPFVINFHVPEEPETYVHRIGRTARAGQAGNAITLCCAEELDDWRGIEKLIRQSVPVARCEWSIDNMQPAPRPPKTPPPGRGDRGGAQAPRRTPPSGGRRR